MTTIRRDIASIPQRSAEETWRKIVDLITGPKSVDKGQLDQATTVMSSLITDEVHAKDPMTLVGVGDRLRLYLLFHADAVTEGMSVDALRWNPTAGDWTLYVPCDEENLDWSGSILRVRAPRIQVHAPGTSPWERGGEANAASTRAPLTVDWNALQR